MFSYICWAEIIPILQSCLEDGKEGEEKKVLCILESIIWLESIPGPEICGNVGLMQVHNLKCLGVRDWA